MTSNPFKASPICGHRCFFPFDEVDCQLPVQHPGHHVGVYISEDGYATIVWTSDPFIGSWDIADITTQAQEDVTEPAAVSTLIQPH